MIDVLGQRSADGEVFRKNRHCSASFEPGMTVSLVARQHGVAAISCSCGVSSIRRQHSRCRRRTGCARVGAGICDEAN
jgi:transposase-like protein